MDELHFEPITPNFLSLWDALRGEKKESFDEETEDDCAFLLDKSGLDARGLLAHNGEEYIGYAILIPSTANSNTSQTEHSRHSLPIVPNGQTGKHAFARSP